MPNCVLVTATWSIVSEPTLFTVMPKLPLRTLPAMCRPRRTRVPVPALTADAGAFCGDGDYGLDVCGGQDADGFVEGERGVGAGVGDVDGAAGGGLRECVGDGGAGCGDGTVAGVRSGGGDPGCGRTRLRGGGKKAEQGGNVGEGPLHWVVSFWGGARRVSFWFMPMGGGLAQWRLWGGGGLGGWTWLCGIGPGVAGDAGFGAGAVWRRFGLGRGLFELRVAGRWGAELGFEVGLEAGAVWG